MPVRILKAENANDGARERRHAVYRIAVLTSSRAQEAFLAEQISRFCVEHCLFPKMDCYHDQESFFEAARNEPLTNAVIALPGVDGLNAVEHLRALCPQTRIIWCSDLDFSLHAFRLRADYFLLEPVTEAALRQGFRIWLDGKNQAEQHWSDRNEHNKENGL
ncbi:response regulator [Faecalibacterium sp. 9]|uniref:response regulator n=1 Tax=Faecalibacterium sp. 9 TaxID=3402018 RepID=UPI003AAA9919